MSGSDVQRRVRSAGWCCLRLGVRDRVVPLFQDRLGSPRQRTPRSGKLIAFGIGMRRTEAVPLPSYGHPTPRCRAVPRTPLQSKRLDPGALAFDLRLAHEHHGVHGRFTHRRPRRADDHGHIRPPAGRATHAGTGRRARACGPCGCEVSEYEDPKPRTTPLNSFPSRVNCAGVRVSSSIWSSAKSANCSEVEIVHSVHSWSSSSHLSIIGRCVAGLVSSPDQARSLDVSQPR